MPQLISTVRHTGPTDSKDGLKQVQIEPLKLFADGLTLVYHEARHVRFLIKHGHLSPTGWENLLSLPKNRVDAWNQLQSVRQAARSRSSAREATEVFQNRLGQSLEDLERLYANPNWKHARAVGRHAWRSVTAIVSSLGDAIARSDKLDIATGCASLLAASHNNGPLRQKILGLDRAVGATTDRWWQSELPGAP